MLYMLYMLCVSLFFSRTISSIIQKEFDSKIFLKELIRPIYFIYESFYNVETIGETPKTVTSLIVTLLYLMISVFVLILSQIALIKGDISFDTFLYIISYVYILFGASYNAFILLNVKKIPNIINKLKIKMVNLYEDK